jgi:hypothetical protein
MNFSIQTKLLAQRSSMGKRIDRLRKSAIIQERTDSGVMTIEGKISEFDGGKSRTLTTRCQRPKKRLLYEIITNNNFKTGCSPTAETTSFPLPPWVSKSPKSRPRQQDVKEAKDIEKAKEAKGAKETKDCKYKTQKAGYIQDVS